ncbi:DUF58 domain-containing protein [Micromonospora globispora]|uniref:DUF58 domain-containing protein n=1 Tax=Micromonospora globispora TaxID=1450148 RepID=A0A317K123_9ACTN|nr:DUF58 domain-containing protein [Micromonospora globispora]PWU46769.1 DUF58 domain-containing protein [Micromonospora globispora]PWU60785.1 DUF58 domain-containing protein [Micromonospora globispora]RQW96026.1 DUF58 domain-containing protein [Micromonospora globispora]
MTSRNEPEPATGWAPTWALGRAVLLTGLLVIAAVLLGRIDLVVLAAPFALGTAYALHRRPTAGPELEISTADAHLVEGAAMSATVAVGNPDTVPYDVAVVRARVSPWLRVEKVSFGGAGVDVARSGADRPFVTAVPTGSAVDLELSGTALRWGRHPVGPAGVRVATADGLLVSRAVITDPVRMRVYPRTEPFEAVEAMPRAAGLVGAHHSRRPGEGGELAGVRVFAPGDRLRRIDWRVSLRARQLHVAATLSDRDAEVVVLLDVLAEAGRSGGVSGTASVLDTTVRAAAAIGEHYLHRGDRVAMLEYGPAARRLRPATGRRQYLTVLEWLLDVHAESSPHEPYDQVFGPQVLSSDALVVVLTPLLDERSAQMLARLARGGRFVVAVDTLPADLSPPKDRGWAEVAYRLWRLDRDTMIGQLREHGVPVVRWAGAGSLDQVLRDVARLATAPRVGAR